MTSGPNGIPYFFLKDCLYALITPLMIIFNLVLKENNFPSKWEEVKVPTGTCSPISIFFQNFLKVLLKKNIFHYVRITFP